MTERIVVGIDGSASSERVVAYAAAEAVRMDARLEIVYVVEPPPVVEPAGVGLVSPEIEELQAAAEQSLAEIVARAREQQPGLDCSGRAPVGQPAQVLGELSDGAACLVVGRRGVGALESALVGSVSLELSAHPRCPVIVIGDTDPIPTDGPIVVGVDDSDFSVAAARFALQEAERRATTVRAVSAYQISPLVVPNEAQLIEELQDSERAEAERVLAAVLTQARTSETAETPVESLVVNGSASDAILGRAADAQLIVVGSQGKGLVRRLLLGSVSRQVVQDADRPVAVINLPDA